VDQEHIIKTEIIEDLVNKTSSDRVLVKDIVIAMESVGFGLIIMIFAFGIIIPLPPPFPSIISTPLVFFSIQMILGYNSPRLPKKFSNISVKRSVLAMLLQRSSPYIRKIERILRPRLFFMISDMTQRIVGFFILLFSTFILLPMPLSNFIPGLGVLIISFGLLGKDGLIVIAGIITGLFGITISTIFVFLGVEALGYLKHFFFG
jgi:hypothetical protein